MPVIDIEKKTLNKIVGKNLSTKKIEEELFKFGMELDAVEGNILKIEITPERVDMMTPEGIGRALRSYLGIKVGLPKYKINSSNYSVIVNDNLKGIREFSACAVIKGIKWDDQMIKEVMNSHAKIDQTYGRMRKKLGIGVYPLENIKFPVKYYAEDPNKIKFIPLDFSNEMNANEILKKHPKGIEFGNIMKGWKKYPIFVDSKKNIMSMPPLINSKEMGEVSSKTKNIFIEVTGTNWKVVNEVLNIVTTSLAERGGNIYSVKMKYGIKAFVTPNLKEEKMKIKIEDIKNTYGINFDNKEIKKLLERMMYDVKIGKDVIVTIPAIRTDILHPLDIIDDVGRAYGYDNMKPETPRVATVGSLQKIELITNKVRQTMVGLGFLEELSLVLTSKDDQFNKMNLKEEEVVETLNAKATGINIARKYLLPELLKCLTYNMHKELPQKIFEVGDVVILDNSNIGASNLRKLSALITDNQVGYEGISSVLDALLTSFGIKYSLSPVEHPSFINGRCARIKVNNKYVGVVGEINPEVIQNWKLENPIAGFEMDLQKIF